MPYCLYILSGLIISTSTAFSQLPVMIQSGSSAGQLESIYKPAPSMLGLDRPMTQIKQTGPLRSPMYGNPNISSPTSYNHYNYLYSVYNYQRMAYPYLAYSGRGRRNPGYFRFNGSTGKNSDIKRQSKTRELKFEGARIVNTQSLLADKMEGRFGAKQFLQLWVKAAGPLKPPPSIRNGETAVYFNTPLEEKSRVISNVKPDISDDDTLKRILVHYKLQEHDQKEASFYSISNEKYKAFMSVAIFAAEDKPVKPILEGQDDSSEDQEGVEILEQGTGNWSIPEPSEYTKNEGTNITRNYVISNEQQLLRISKYIEIPEADLTKILETNWKKEVIYITGRLFMNRREGRSQFDRKIVSVSEWRHRPGLTRVKHYVEIVEPQKARDQSVDLDQMTQEDLEELVFYSHWVRVAIPRNFGGLKTFGIRSSKD